MNKPFFSGILLLGGSGQRLGEKTPKQFVKLQDKELFLYSLETFLASDLFQEVILVVPANYAAWVREKTKNLSSLVKIIEGGKTRQDSSFQGILATSKNSDFVIIHDAARPFVSKKLLKKHSELLPKFQALDTCLPCIDTIIYADEKLCFLEKIPERKRCFQGQTPQSFATPLIKKAHLLAQKKGLNNASDDCRLVMGLEEKIGIVLGEERNFKITTHSDWDFASFLLEKKNASFV